MNDETVFKVRVATVATFIMSFMSVLILALSTWVGIINADVNSHTKQIATVQENTRLLDSAVERIEKKLDKLIDTK